MSDMYSTDILQLAADIPHIGRLSAPDATAYKASRICGSELTLDLRISEGRIIGLGLEFEACALGQASASVFARAALGASRQEIIDARNALRAMLQGAGAPPRGRFAALVALQPAASYRQRHGSILLAFEAAVTAFEMAASSDIKKL